MAVSSSGVRRTDGSRASGQGPGPRVEAGLIDVGHAEQAAESPGHGQWIRERIDQIHRASSRSRRSAGVAASIIGPGGRRCGGGERRGHQRPQPGVVGRVEEQQAADPWLTMSSTLTSVGPWRSSVDRRGSCRRAVTSARPRTNQMECRRPGPDEARQLGSARRGIRVVPERGRHGIDEELVGDRQHGATRFVRVSSRYVAFAVRVAVSSLPTRPTRDDTRTKLFEAAAEVFEARA